MSPIKTLLLIDFNQRPSFHQRFSRVTASNDLKLFEKLPPYWTVFHYNPALLRLSYWPFPNIREYHLMYILLVPILISPLIYFEAFTAPF